MEINTKLKALRKQKGISQDEAAQCLGVSLSSYQKYERDKNSVTPSLEALLKLADFYGVTTDYLLGREPEQNPIAMLNLENRERSTLEKYTQLPKEVRQIIIDTMIQLAEAAQKSERCITISGNSEKAIARSSDKTYIDPPTPEQEAAAEDITDDENF